MTDRRSLFFLVASAAAFAMVPIAQQKFRHVAVIVGVVYAVYAVLSFADSRLRFRRRRP